jgi:acetyl esterase/lipase
LQLFSGNKRPQITPFLIEVQVPAPCIIVCPGGGYELTSPRESDPVARAYNKMGFHAFVLHYRVAPHKHPDPLIDLSNTVALIRTNADSLNVDPDKIVICGFSAGGHLAASLGVHWNKPYLINTLNSQPGLNKANALVLCYPVITTGKFINKDTFKNLLGDNSDEGLLDHLSVEKNIGPHTPPTFIWHTVEDETVPMENSSLFVQELRKKSIIFEFHLFSFDSHGISLATEKTIQVEKKRYADPHVATWLKTSASWLGQIL